MSGFGQCQICGGAIERAGWDDICFACQESEKAELTDDEIEDDQEERWQRIDEENAFLYGVPIEQRSSGGGRWRG